jgi:S-formylglutathione hydrolase
MPDAALSVHRLDTRLVPAPVEYAVLLPPQHGVGGERCPLLLLLHGGAGSCEFLAQVRPIFEGAWRAGALPPLVVATPSAERSFYLDYRDGSQKWETLLLDELLPRLRATHRVAGDREGTLVGGVSMGGLGSLRLAFKHPDRFRAVAALEPGIEPALSYAEIQPRDRLYRSQALYEEKFGKPVDEAYWQANNPANLARINATAIVDSGLSIYFECGDEDSFYLYHGAEFLHRILFDAGIPHECRLVRGADHLGPSLGPRLLDALAFLGRELQPPAEAAAPGAPSLPELKSMVAAMREEAGYVDAETRLVNAPDALIHVTLRGGGEPVVLIPSLGRGASDFDDLATRLALAGWRAVTPQPRGIGASTGPLEGLTLHDLARDIAAVVEATGDGPATLVGHAFGNRVARTLAADRPDLVKRVALLAAGGRVPPPSEVQRALAGSFNELQTRAERLDAIRLAFFADRNDPAVWLDGWHARAAAAEGQANRATPVDEWWGAGSAPILVVQALEDRVATRENARLLQEEYGERVRVVEIADAGHAMLPEQPEAIAKAILDWLAEAAT